MRAAVQRIFRPTLPDVTKRDTTARFRLPLEIPASEAPPVADGTRFPPPAAREDLVVRSAVLARLRSSTATVICLRAPAGYGKTTVLTQWAAEDRRPFAWISLDPAHDDPVMLGNRLTAAIADLQPATTGLHPVLTGQEPGFSTVVLPALGRQLHDASIPFVLVLDDVQLIGHPAAVRMLSLVISAMPTGSQIALASRTEPPIALSRLRADGCLLEITAGDLMLDRREAGIVLEGTGLSPEDTDAIVASAEGWPVGIHLCGMAVGPPAAERRSDGVPGSLSVSGGERIVVDYLRSELWSDIDEPTMQFLTRTSILSALSGPLCDAVTASRGSGSLLRRLRGSNLLMVPLDSQDNRFRYHRLMLDALRGELERRESDLIPILHDRASRWFESNGDLDSAIRHATLAGDLNRTADLVWTNVRPAFGALDTLPRWLHGMPDTQIARSPQLACASAWVALCSGDLRTMGRWILVTQAYFTAHPPGDPRQLEVRATLDLLLALRGDWGLCIGEAASRAYERISPVSPWRPFACLLMAVGHILAANPAEAVGHLRQGESLAAELDVPQVRADCLATLGLLAIQAGEWERGAALVARAREVIVVNDLLELSTSAYTISVVALAQARGGDHVVARATLVLARRLTAELLGIAPWYQVLGRTLHATASLYLHDVPTARLLTRQARQLLDDGGDSGFLRAAVARCERTLADLPADPAMRVSPLTTAELRVLQYLPTHLSFPEIAKGLFVSRHTIKTQALAVYHKLGVSSRNEAVDRARHLGLLPGLLPALPAAARG